MARLRPCPSCSRHVRTSDAVCPFCAAPSTFVDRGPTDEALGDTRPSRSGLVFGVAVGAVAVSSLLFGTGCPLYGSPSRERDDGGANDSAVSADTGRD